MSVQVVTVFESLSSRIMPLTVAKSQLDLSSLVRGHPDIHCLQGLIAILDGMLEGPLKGWLTVDKRYGKKGGRGKRSPPEISNPLGLDIFGKLVKGAAAAAAEGVVETPKVETPKTQSVKYLTVVVGQTTMKYFRGTLVFATPTGERISVRILASKVGKGDKAAAPVEGVTTTDLPKPRRGRPAKGTKPDGVQKPRQPRQPKAKPTVDLLTVPTPEQAAAEAAAALVPEVPLPTQLPEPVDSEGVLPPLSTSVPVAAPLVPVATPVISLVPLAPLIPSVPAPIVVPMLSLLAPIELVPTVSSVLDGSQV